MTPIQKLRAIVEALEKFQVDIAHALVYGGNTHNFDDIVAGVLANHYEVLYNDHAIAICEREFYASVRFYHVFVAAGTLDAVLALQEQMLERARAHNCTKLTMFGRFGWKRVLSSHSWTPKLIYMARDVTPS